MIALLLVGGPTTAPETETPAVVLSEFFDGPCRTLDLSQQLSRLGVYAPRRPPLLTPDDAYAAFAEGAIESFLQHEFRSPENSVRGSTLEARKRDEARFVYLATVRYLLRRDIRRSVSAMAADALLAEHDRQGAPVWLVGDSVGSTIALDLATGDHQSAVAGLVTLGSPLGGLASVPLIGRDIVAPILRDASLRWLDVCAYDDLASRWPIGRATGFVPGPTAAVVVGSPREAFPGYFREPVIGQWVGQFVALAEVP